VRVAHTGSLCCEEGPLLRTTVESSTSRPCSILACCKQYLAALDGVPRTSPAVLTDRSTPHVLTSCLVLCRIAATQEEDLQTEKGERVQLGVTTSRLLLAFSRASSHACKRFSVSALQFLVAAPNSSACPASSRAVASAGEIPAEVCGRCS
jgi:hypothetical protein